MTDEYGDTGEGSYEDSQTSGSSDDGSAETGDTGGPELDEKGNPSPVPYERFKESRSQLTDAKDDVSRLQGEMDALRAQGQQQAEWNQWAWAKLQEQQAAPRNLGYEDPLLEPEPHEKNERRIAQLESQLQQQSDYFTERAQSLEIDQAERHITSEVDAARQRFPEMREVDVINAIAQNPNASVMALAKRSHESEVAAFETRAKKKGYKTPPKSLQRSRGPAAVRQDFGEDLDAAEAAARAFLGGE